MEPSVREAERAAEDAEGSRFAERLGRIGLAARGVMWLVIGVLAGQVALGDQAQADSDGAFRALADQPHGTALLVLLAVGFSGYAAWRLLQAAGGHHDQSGKRRVLERFVSLAIGLVYVALAVRTVLFLLGRGSSGDAAMPLTARLMAAPGGRWLVGLAGLVLVGGGIARFVYALVKQHTEGLESYRVPGSAERPFRVLGTAGAAAHGVVLSLIGGFVIQAAVTFDPRQAKGLDAALKALAQVTYGQVLLLVSAVLMLCYAAWSFTESAYKRI